MVGALCRALVDREIHRVPALLEDLVTAAREDESFPQSVTNELAQLNVDDDPKMFRFLNSPKLRRKKSMWPQTDGNLTERERERRASLSPPQMSAESLWVALLKANVGGIPEVEEHVSTLISLSQRDHSTLSKPQQKITVDIGLETKLQLMTSKNHSIGASFVWPAGHWLATAFGDIIPIKGRRLLDLGTGLGVVPIAACIKGATEAVGTDYCVSALEMAEFSASQNEGIKDAFSIAVLDWDVFETSDDPWRSVGGAERFDLLCAADCIYGTTHGDKVFKILQSFFAVERDAEAILVCGENREGTSHFFSLLEALPRDGLFVTKYHAEIPEIKGMHHGSRLRIYRIGTYPRVLPLPTE
eukprot:GEMP01063783.1.p1 GENE.GEMP01063783.1~~GEMP01063783.1.p1  ORF type:complete len:358 (+),score=77.97 GEMP01063783.1:41-1114(+)